MALVPSFLTRKRRPDDAAVYGMGNDRDGEFAGLRVYITAGIDDL